MEADSEASKPETLNAIFISSDLTFNDLLNCSRARAQFLSDLSRLRRLLKNFYESEDADKLTKFPGEGRVSPLSLCKTLPSLLVLGGLTVSLLLTESGRKVYARTWVYGTLLGWLWVNVSP